MKLTIELDDNTKNELMKEFKRLYLQTIDDARYSVVPLKDKLTIDEACTLLDVSRNTFKENYIKNGLPTYKIGNRLYIDRKELHQFMKKYQI